MYAASDSDVLQALADGQYVFRLHLLCEPLRRLGPGGGGSPGEPEEPEIRGRLDPYLRLLSQILEIRAAVETNRALARLIQLDLGGTRVPWSKFYFEFGEYFSCHKHLQRRRSAHPVCIEGHVRSVRPAGQYGPPMFYLAGESLRSEDAHDVASPQVRIQGPRVSLPKPGTRVMVFGLWRAHRPSEPTDGSRTRFHRIVADIYRDRQVMAIPE